MIKEKVDHEQVLTDFVVNQKKRIQRLKEKRIKKSDKK